MNARAFLTLVAAMSLSATATARDAHAAPVAQGVAVTFSFEGCGESLTPELERIARIELHAPAGAAGTATTVAVACEGDEVQLRVVDPLTSKRVERTVSLAGVAGHDRARLLALSIAELARSSWLELEFDAAPALPVVDAVRVSDEEKERARAVAVVARPAVWHAYASIEGLLVPTVGRPLVGLSLGVQRGVISEAMFVEGAISAWDGVAERSTGAVTIRQLAIDPALGLRLAMVDLTLSARVGWASLAGSPSGSAFRGDATSGFVFGSHVGASVGVAGPLRIWVKSGWLLRGQRGTVDGDSDVTLGGFYGSLGLGLRLGL